MEGQLTGKIQDISNVNLLLRLKLGKSAAPFIGRFRPIPEAALLGVAEISTSDAMT